MTFHPLAEKIGHGFQTINTLDSKIRAWLKEKIPKLAAITEGIEPYATNTVKEILEMEENLQTSEEFTKEELRLLRKIHWASEQAGDARKHDCPGFDCSACNITALFESRNDLQFFYEKWERLDDELGKKEKLNEDSKFWPCPHIEMDAESNRWKPVFQSGLIGTIDAWKECPICLAKRPEPEKKRALWEILKAISDRTPMLCTEEQWEKFYKDLARAAEEWFGK